MLATAREARFFPEEEEGTTVGVEISTGGLDVRVKDELKSGRVSSEVSEGAEVPNCPIITLGCWRPVAEAGVEARDGVKVVRWFERWSAGAKEEEVVRRT